MPYHKLIDRCWGLGLYWGSRGGWHAGQCKMVGTTHHLFSSGTLQNWLYLASYPATRRSVHWEFRSKWNQMFYVWLQVVAAQSPLINWIDPDCRRRDCPESVFGFFGGQGFCNQRRKPNQGRQLFRWSMVSYLNTGCEFCSRSYSWLYSSTV